MTAAAQRVPEVAPASTQAYDDGFRQSALTLARAFQYDPMMTYLEPDPVRRARILPWFLGTVVRYAQTYGEVHVTPGGEAVACWLTPGDTTVTTGRIFRTGGFPTPLRLGWAAFQRLSELQRYLGEAHARHAPDPHYYLYLLGVDPLARGQGLGRALLEPLLARADAEGRPCYLETQNPQNVAVYGSVGFRVVSEGAVPGRGLTVWALRREPNSRADAGSGLSRPPGV